MNGIDLGGRPIKVNVATPHVPVARTTPLPSYPIRPNPTPIYIMTPNGYGTAMDMSNRNDGPDRNNVHQLMNNPGNMIPSNAAFYSPSHPGYMNHPTFPTNFWIHNTTTPGHPGYYTTNGTTAYPIQLSPHSSNNNGTNNTNPNNSSSSSYSQISSLSPSSTAAAVYQVPYYPIGSSPTAQTSSNTNGETNNISISTTINTTNSSNSSSLTSSSTSVNPSAQSYTPLTTNTASVSSNPSSNRDNLHSQTTSYVGYNNLSSQQTSASRTYNG